MKLLIERRVLSPQKGVLVFGEEGKSVLKILKNDAHLKKARQGKTEHIDLKKMHFWG